MALTVTYPSGSRATRLELDSIPANTEATHWEFSSDHNGTFSVSTTISGSSNGNVLGGSLSYIDIWLPPSQTFEIRTRHAITDDAPTAWTSSSPFVSRGLLNSYETYLALSGLSDDSDVVSR